MIVFVLNKHKQPLMPCSPAKARKLLKEGKAKVIRREPFTIKLLYGSRGYKQETQAGMDTGSKKVGCAVVGNGRVYYQSEITIRDDVSSKMESRMNDVLKGILVVEDKNTNYQNTEIEAVMRHPKFLGTIPKQDRGTQV